MNTQEQIGKLQGLLARIQQNAAKPRVAGAPAPAAPTQAHAAPPAPVAPEAHAAPPAPPAHVPDALDELLDAGAAPVASHQPLDEVDVSLESFAPPPVAAAPAPSEAPEAEPIPLVAVAARPSTPEADDTFSLESEVSEVRMATGPREPAGEVTVAAIEAEAEPLGTEELSEDDLVEVTEGTPLPPEVTTSSSDVDIDFEDEDEEQPPASSQRSKVATTMDEALAAAAAQIDSEHEVPLKTPPPESGPQEAPPAALTAPAAPDVDALLGSELDIPVREAVAHAGPTPEQLGQTIDLEEARGPALELEEHHAAADLPEPVEELEVALPGRAVSGGYDDNLEPPPEARDDLEAHRRRMEDDIPPPPESLAQLPSVQPAPEVMAEIVPIVAAPAQPEAPEIVARTAPMGSAETFSSVREPFRPRSFVELLDASLSLGGE
jgi:hypothetical protein